MRSPAPVGGVGALTGGKVSAVRQEAAASVFKQSGDKIISVYRQCEVWLRAGGTGYKDARPYNHGGTGTGGLTHQWWQEWRGRLDPREARPGKPSSRHVTSPSSGALTHFMAAEQAPFPWVAQGCFPN